MSHRPDVTLWHALSPPWPACPCRVCTAEAALHVRFAGADCPSIDGDVSLDIPFLTHPHDALRFVLTKYPALHSIEFAVMSLLDIIVYSTAHHPIVSYQVAVDGAPEGRAVLRVWAHEDVDAAVAAFAQRWELSESDRAELERKSVNIIHVVADNDPAVLTFAFPDQSMFGNLRAVRGAYLGLARGMFAGLVICRLMWWLHCWPQDAGLSKFTAQGPARVDSTAFSPSVAGQIFHALKGTLGASHCGEEDTKICFLLTDHPHVRATAAWFPDPVQWAVGPLLEPFQPALVSDAPVMRALLQCRASPLPRRACEASPCWPVAFTGCGYSGTGLLERLFRSGLGVDLRHEELGDDGTSSWPVAFSAADAAFERVMVQVRHPLAVVRSHQNTAFAFNLERELEAAGVKDFVYADDVLPPWAGAAMGPPFQALAWWLSANVLALEHADCWWRLEDLVAHPRMAVEICARAWPGRCGCEDVDWAAVLQATGRSNRHAVDEASHPGRAAWDVSAEAWHAACLLARQ